MPISVAEPSSSAWHVLELMDEQLAALIQTGQFSEVDDPG